MKHKHHIIPRYAGGTDCANNIIEVTCEEHAELHFARYLEYGHWQDWLAYRVLSGQMRQEEAIAIKCREAGKKSKGTTGQTLSQETRRRISVSKTGKPRKKPPPLTPEHRANISKTRLERYGKTDEEKKQTTLEWRERYRERKNMLARRRYNRKS
jgi:hypothetical protein